MIKKLVPCAALLLYSRGFCIFGNPFADWLVKNSETKGPFLASLLFSAAALIFTHRFFIPSRNIRPLPYFLGTFFDVSANNFCCYCSFPINVGVSI